MNKVVVTTISSIMAILMLTGMLPNLALATLGDDEMRGDESIDECAEKFDPYYDRERFQRCSGGIGDPMN
jgi:hypothetical protein